MVMDPLFGKAEFVAGPQSIYVYLHTREKNYVYLIGENHEKPGSTKHQNIIDFIRAKGANTHVFVEKGLDETLLAADIVHNTSTAVHPHLMWIAHDYIYADYKYTLSMCDVRRDSPFHILEAIYQFGSYVQIHRRDIRGNKEKMKALHDRFKTFEKDVFAHIASREKCMKFLRHMTSPGLSTPRWYQTWLDAFANEESSILTDRNNKLKDELRKHTSAEWEKSIYEYAELNWHNLVEKSSVYSVALHHADSTWHSQSPNMVADKHFELRWYFAVLFGVLMEMYMLISICTSDAKMRVAVMGSDHCTRLIHYFDSNEEYERMYIANSSNGEFIDLQYDKVLNLRETPYKVVNGLKQFIKRRKT